MDTGKQDERTPGPALLHAHLEQPWSGFSCLHIGPFKIGILITNEDGEQDPEAAGAAFESWVRTCNEHDRLTARVEELERAHAWQPIETAPITPMFEVIIAGQYDNGIWYVEEGFRNPLGHWNGRKINPPSHWMLLPPAPSEARTTLDAAIKTEED